MTILELFYEYERRSVAYRAALVKSDKTKLASDEEAANYLGDDLNLSGDRLRDKAIAEGASHVVLNNMLYTLMWKRGRYCEEEFAIVRAAILEYIRSL